jgi:phosphatidylserine decarboxylase
LVCAMVRDGIYYALGMLVAAAALWWISPFLAALPLVLAIFFLWFFRDPERTIPIEPGLVVSPADGTVTSVGNAKVNGEDKQHISIFLNVFNVHVNRSPISGVVRQVHYQKGKFGNAMAAASSEANEQNVVTMEGDGQVVVFRQIAGLLARRIVFTKAVGDQLARGERVGLIKFGSRVDVVLEPEVEVTVKVGDKVAGGSSIIGRIREVVSVESGAAARSHLREGTRP